MESNSATMEQEERNLLYVRNLSPYFDRKNARIGFRQLDAGFARHDAQYHKISLYINGIPAQTLNKDGLCEWRFSIPLRNLELEADKFFRIRSLRRYYKRADKRYGYFSNDAGFAVVHDYNDKQFMNLFVNELPAQTQNRDGVLQYRFEVLLAERKAADNNQAPPQTQKFPLPQPELDESPEDDIPF